MADDPPLPFLPRTLTADDISEDMLGGLIRSLACADLADRYHRWPHVCRWPAWATGPQRHRAVDRTRDMISTAAAQQRRARRRTWEDTNMPPGKANLSLYQGDDFEAVAAFTTAGTAVDLTGYTFRADIRPMVADDDPSPTPVATLETTLLDPAAGTVLLALDHATTATMPTTGLVWDLEGTDPEGDVTTYLAGTVKVTAEVTR